MLCMCEDRFLSPWTAASLSMKLFSIPIPCNSVKGEVSYQELKETLYTASLPSTHG